MAIGFNKKLPRSCKYCVHGKPSIIDGEILCKKHGVTGGRDYCHSYKYDPLMREPDRIKISNNYSPEDFSL